MQEADPHRVRVAVIDDEEFQRELVRAYLEEVCLEPVGEAEDGESGLAMVEETHPEVVIVDYSMPGSMDGVEVTRRLRERHPDLEIIAFTAMHDATVELAFGEAGASMFFRKIELDLLVRHLGERASQSARNDTA